MNASYVCMITAVHPTIPPVPITPNTQLLPWGAAGTIGGLKADKEAVAALIGLEAGQFEFIWNGNLVREDEVWGKWLEAPELLQIVRRVPEGGITLQIQYNDRIFPCKIAPTACILELKQEIETSCEIAISDQILMREKRVFADIYQTIEELGLMSGHILQLKRKSDHFFLYLTITEWWKGLLEVDMDATVVSLKEKIENELNYSHQNVILLQEKGLNVLSDDQTLANYSINTEDSLLLKYQNIDFIRDISVTFPRGNSVDYQYGQRTAISTLKKDLSDAANITNDSALLATPSDLILTATSRPISMVPDTLALLDTTNLRTCMLVERVEIGQAYLIGNVKTVQEVKMRLEKDFKHPENEQILIYSDKILQNDLELPAKCAGVDYQLYLLSDLVTIYVYTSGNGWISIQLAYGSRISDLKAKLEELEGIAAERQVLIYSKLVLSDASTLPECAILPDSTILLFTYFPLESSPDMPNIIEKLKDKAYARLREIGIKALTVIRRLQGKFHLPLRVYELRFNGELVAEDCKVPMAIGAMLEMREIPSRQEELRTNLSFFAAALSSKLAPAVFLPASDYDLWNPLSLADCKSLLLALVMKGRVNSSKGKEKILVNVCVLGGVGFALTIHSSDTILAVKEQITLVKEQINALGVPVNQQILLFAGDVLENTNLVEKYHIRENDCLMLIRISVNCDYYSLPLDLFLPNIPPRDDPQIGLFRYPFPLFDGQIVHSIHPISSFHGLSSFPQFLNLNLVNSFTGTKATKIYSRNDLNRTWKMAEKWQLYEGCQFMCAFELKSFFDWEFTQTYEGESITVTPEAYSIPVAMLIQEYFASIEVNIEYKSRATKVRVNPGDAVETILREYGKKVKEEFVLARLDLKGKGGNTVVYDLKVYKDLEAGKRRICDLGIVAGAVLVLRKYVKKSNLVLGPVISRKRMQHQR